MTNRPTRLLTSAVVACLLAATGCSDSDTTETATSAAPPTDLAPTEQIPINEWVAAFERHCIETAERRSDPALTSDDLAEISSNSIREMRAIGEPATQAADALILLEVIESQTNPTDLSQEEIDEQDTKFLAAAATLGISDECLGGAPG